VVIMATTTMSLEHSRSARRVRSPSFSLCQLVLLLRFRGGAKDLFSLAHTYLNYLLVFPIIPEQNCGSSGGGGGGGGGSNIVSATGGQLRVEGPSIEGQCIPAFPVINDAHDLTFCRSNNDCDGYEPKKAGLGTVCCLRDYCFCGTDANAGGCYADPQFRLGESSSSFIITVPTVPSPPTDTP
jgi:hypothetical protein